MAGEYSNKDSGFVVRLRSTAIRRVVGMTGAWLSAIGSSVDRADESGCTARQEGITRIYEFLIDLY